MPDQKSIEDELKKLIVESLDLEDVAPETIDSQAAIFIEGLGLDSIDALELGMAVSRHWGIHMSQNPQENRGHFRSVSALATYVLSQLGRSDV